VGHAIVAAGRTLRDPVKSLTDHLIAHAEETERSLAQHSLVPGGRDSAGRRPSLQLRLSFTNRPFGSEASRAEPAGAEIGARQLRSGAHVQLVETRLLSTWNRSWRRRRNKVQRFIEVG
jgi:hypothetical protein